MRRPGSVEPTGSRYSTRIVPETPSPWQRPQPPSQPRKAAPCPKPGLDWHPKLRRWSDCRCFKGRRCGRPASGRGFSAVRSPRGLASHKGRPLDRREGSPPTRDGPQVAERARLPQGTAMRRRALRTSGFPAELA